MLRQRKDVIEAYIHWVGICWWRLCVAETMTKCETKRKLLEKVRNEKFAEESYENF